METTTPVTGAPAVDAGTNGAATAAQQPDPVAAPSAPDPATAPPNAALLVLRVPDGRGGDRILVGVPEGARAMAPVEQLHLLSAAADQLRLDLLIAVTSDAVVAKLDAAAQRKRIVTATMQQAPPGRPLTVVRR